MARLAFSSSRSWARAASVLHKSTYRPDYIIINGWTAATQRHNAHSTRQTRGQDAPALLDGRERALGVGQLPLLQGQPLRHEEQARLHPAVNDRSKMV